MTAAQIRLTPAFSSDTCNFSKLQESIKLERFFSWQIRHRKSVIALFIVIISICAFCSAKVKVNSNLAGYLPKDSA